MNNRLNAAAAAAAFAALAALAPCRAIAEGAADEAPAAEAANAAVYITSMDIEDILLDDAPAAPAASAFASESESGAPSATVEYEIVEVEVVKQETTAEVEIMAEAESIVGVEALGDEAIDESGAENYSPATVVEDIEDPAQEASEPSALNAADDAEESAEEDAEEVEDAAPEISEPPAFDAAEDAEIAEDIEGVEDADEVKNDEAAENVEDAEDAEKSAEENASASIVEDIIDVYVDEEINDANAEDASEKATASESEDATASEGENAAASESDDATASEREDATAGESEDAATAGEGDDTDDSREAEAPRSQDSATFAPSSDISYIEVVSIKDAPSPQHFPVFMTAAEAVLSECILRFPNEPFALSGDIVTRKMYGVELQRCKFKSLISWTPQSFAAEYEIFSTSGELLETVRATRAGGAATILERFEGAAKTPAPAPALNDAIQGSDVTWLDISMDFIWWKDPVFDGKGKIKDRDCVIIKVFPREPIPGCAAVRLWIDEEQRVVMQAVQLDENGKDARRMWIRSVQKIDDRWLVKDIEVETPASKRRTKIHVENAVRADAL